MHTGVSLDTEVSPLGEDLNPTRQLWREVQEAKEAIKKRSPEYFNKAGRGTTAGVAVKRI